MFQNVTCPRLGRGHPAAARAGPDQIRRKQSKFISRTVSIWSGKNPKQFERVNLRPIIISIIYLQYASVRTNEVLNRSCIQKYFLSDSHATDHTVTVDGAFEVLRVPKVLSTPKVASVTSEHISIENKIEPREILEKNEFYWANPQNCYFSLLWCTRLTFSSLLTAPNGLRSYARWLFRGRIQQGTIFILWSVPKNWLDLA